jgi:FkbM family methyltransferase
MTFVDIGANVGYFTTMAARAVGPRGRVLAVEPEPHNFELLSSNVVDNGLDCVDLVQAALGSTRGEASLFLNADNHGDHRLWSNSPDAVGRQTMTVPTWTLDELVAAHDLDHVDVVKIDVQGYEHEIAKGMIDLLESADRLSILSEFWPYGIERAGGSPEGYLAEFRTRGFVTHLILPEGPVPCSDPGAIFAALPPMDTQAPDGCYVNLLFRKG